MTREVLPVVRYKFARALVACLRCCRSKVCRRRRLLLLWKFDLLLPRWLATREVVVAELSHTLESTVDLLPELYAIVVVAVMISDLILETLGSFEPLPWMLIKLLGERFGSCGGCWTYHRAPTDCSTFRIGRWEQYLFLLRPFKKTIDAVLLQLLTVLTLNATFWSLESFLWRLVLDGRNGREWVHCLRMLT